MEDFIVAGTALLMIALAVFAFAGAVWIAGSVVALAVRVMRRPGR